VTATADVDTEHVERARRRIVLWFAVAAIAAGVAMRVWIATGVLGTLNADEAISGLMARALLDGDVDVFFWGQAYGGTLEVVPLAALMATVGDQAGLTVLPLVEAAGIGVLTYLLARRRLPMEWALAVVGLAAVAPAAAVWFSTRPMLFYQPAILLGLGALLLAERLADRVGQPDHWTWAALGLLLGLGWWTSTQILFFAVPAVYWVIARRAVTSWRPLLLATGGAVLGALPWIVANLTSRGRSLRELPEGDGSYLDHLVAQVERGWPMTFGLRRPFDESWLGGALTPLLVIAAIGAAVAVTVTFVRHAHLRSPLAGVLLAFPLLHALAPTGSFVGNGRYYVFVVPALAYAVVAALSTWRWSVAATIAVLPVVTIVTLSTLLDLRTVQLGPTGLDAVADALAERDVEHVEADYWIAYPLAWADHDLRVAPTNTDRRPAWSAEVVAADVVAHVFWMPYDVDARRYADTIEALRSSGDTEELVVGDHRVVIVGRER
jgi:hypothetical protein